MQGEVIWFDSAKGYGFIKPFNGEGDLFVHHTDINMGGYRKLDAGQSVEFDVIVGKKGPQASEVTVVRGED